MIMTRSPLRISLGGGGTDLPSYYQEHSGFLVAAGIDKYVYILLHRRFVPRILLKYSQMEEVERIEDIKHPLIREKHDPEMIANLHFVKQIGRDSKDALEAGDLQRFGELMNTHWEHKKGRSKSMSNDRIDHWYDLAIRKGPSGAS